MHCHIDTLDLWQPYADDAAMSTTHTATDAQREVAFAQYVTTALWSSTDQSDDTGGQPLDANYDRDDIAVEALATMRLEVDGFISALESEPETLRDYVAAYAGDADEAFSQLGHDLWLTQNHHGAGFWDRGIGAVGDQLTALAHACGSVDLYVGDDGRVYVA